MFLLLGRRRYLLLALPPLAAAGVVAALAYQHFAAPAPPPAPAPEAGGAIAPAAAAGILVHVNGAVAHPGLYRLQRGDRVYAALEAAGGLSDQADPQRLPNLAGRLRDGEQVRVPFLRAPGTGKVSGPKVSVNSASAEDLASVPGVTPAMAAAIVDYRSRYGPFTSLKELQTGVGMDPAAYAQARPHLAL